ncbi:MAG: nucleotide sugar dehydrogenase [Actinomycetota bacterium]|nr:nucleotide sugar dehydrogenase [Actinomycetota bacterium]
MNVSVVGLGKLGSPLATVLASAGHSVMGVDTNERVVAMLASGISPVPEPGLQELLDANCERLTATTSLDEAIAGTELTCVIVPTPTGSNREFSLEFLLPAVTSIGKALRAKRTRHVVVITSTVMPGQTDGPIQETLETALGEPLGSRVGLCYNPEFIALGSVIRDMQRPDLVLIGSSHSWAADIVERLAGSFCESDPFVAKLATIDAEIAKLAVNTFVTTKISYANMIAEICERLPGANASAVTEAIGHDRRIGGEYLRPATAYGGPCFPRDNVALTALAERLGARAEIARATHATNEHQITRLVDLVERSAAAGATVAVLGLSYKPGTPVIEVSAGVSLAHALSGHGFRVRVFDPEALEQVGRDLETSAHVTASLEEAVFGADVVVIATAWPQFAGLDPQTMLADCGSGPKTIIDCWGLLEAANVPKGIELVRIGFGDRVLPVSTSAAPEA